MEKAAMLRAQRILVALLMVLSMVVCALGTQPSPVVKQKSISVACETRNEGAKASRDDTKKSKPDQSDSSQSETDEDASSSSSSSAGQVLEEEHGHKVVYFVNMTFQANHGLGFWSERIDRAFEAWFYVTAHPPLTPPPNVA